MDQFGNLDTADSPEFLANPANNPMAEYLAKLWRQITPTQRTPGGLLAPKPQLNPAPIDPKQTAAMADLSGMPVGALPPKRQPTRTRPQVTPQEAPLSAVAPAQIDVRDDADEPIVPPVAVPAQPATPQQKGFREQYMERLAGMAKQPAPGMTDEQKGQALLEAGLAIMAAGSRPGASALGAIGQGGQAGTAVAREMQRINRERADKDRSEARADVRTEFDLAGRDADRAINKEDKTENREIRRLEGEERSAARKENSAINARKMALLEEQVRQGKYQTVKDGGTGTYTLMPLVAGLEPIKTGIKYDRPASDIPSELRILETLSKRPDLMQTAKEYRGDKGGMSDKDIINDAVKLTGEQVKGGSTENTETLLQRNADAIKRAAGKPVAPAPLPAGIPPGSKQVGTSKGNPVYQTPDGRKLVVTK